MALRPSWRGQLRLSLVSCPISLFNAISPSGDVHFHLINPKTNHRVHAITVDAETEKPIDRKDLVKGFELAKGQFVTLTEKEIDAVRLESTKVLDIEAFVPAKDVDRLYWDNPYYLVPDGDLGTETLNVIRAAMDETGQIALARIVVAQRERLLAIESHEGLVLATTLRSHDEIKKPKSVRANQRKGRPDTEMVDIAKKIIAKKKTSFNPVKFKDRYEDALRELIKRKQKGEEIIEAEQPRPNNVVDLMDALKASLAGKAKTASNKSHPPERPSKRRKAKAA